MGNRAAIVAVTLGAWAILGAIGAEAAVATGTARAKLVRAGAPKALALAASDEAARHAEMIIYNDDTCPVTYAIELKAGEGQASDDDAELPQVRYAPRGTTLQPGQTQTVRLLLESSHAAAAPLKPLHRLVITKLNRCSQAPDGRQYAVSVPVLSPNR